MWEELSFELVGAGVTIALLLSITDIKRALIEKLLLLEAGLIVLTGAFATGHHYYWIGLPTYWLIIGGVFSAIQVIPIIIVYIYAWNFHNVLPCAFSTIWGFWPISNRC